MKNFTILSLVVLSLVCWPAITSAITANTMASPLIQTIAPAPLPFSISLLSPTDENLVTHGHWISIIWYSDGIPPQRLYYLFLVRDGTSTRPLSIAAVDPLYGRTFNGLASYVWTVPSNLPLGPDYRIVFSKTSTYNFSQVVASTESFSIR